MKPIEFKGFGFPILLLGFKYKKVGKEKVLDVNYPELTKTVLKALIVKKGRLTGAELRFIILNCNELRNITPFRWGGVA